ncbi:MAG: phytanoyl-CoA dioxygenase family protein [Planctomycetota bacterium]
MGSSVPAHLRNAPGFIQNLLQVKTFGIDRYVERGYTHVESLKFDWRSHVANREARAAFRAHRPVLDSVQNRVVSQLMESGVAVLPVSEFLTDLNPWNDLQRLMDEWVGSEEVRQHVANYQTRPDRQWKEYLARMYHPEKIVTLEDPWLRFGLSSRIIDVANSYLGLMSKFIFMDVWNTIPLAQHDQVSTGSQLWHRDPEDRRMIKVFLYFSDVDQTAGPMHYIPHSRRGDKYGRLWQRVPPFGGRPAGDEELESKIPRSDWKVLTCPKGTMVFADTSALHMGGRATEKSRLVAIWAFTGHACTRPLNFLLNLPEKKESVPLTTQFACYSWNRGRK